MSTNNHTAISNGATNDASTVNTPLGQLDDAMGDVSTLTTTATTLTGAANELDAKIDAVGGDLTVALDTDGTLKAGAVDNASVIASGIITGTQLASSFSVTGTITAGVLLGDGSGITGLTGATGGVSNTGSTTIGADTNVSGVGEIALQTGGTTKLLITNGGGGLFTGALGAGAGHFRTDSQVELQGSNGLLSIFNTSNPGVTNKESAIAWGGYDSGGTARKTASVSAIWTDTTAATGAAVLRLNATYNGGTSDDIALRIFGNGGVSIFGAGDFAIPGSKILSVGGQVKVNTGTALSGNAYITARFQNAGGTKGVNIGYDNTEVTGLIIADQVSSGLALWTHNGTAFGERVKIPSTGGMFVTGTIGAGAGYFRTDAQIEVQGDSGLISVFQTSDPGVTTKESAIVYGGYDSAGTARKTASISSKWKDATATTGVAMLRLNATYNGGASDDIALRIWGNNGVAFFGAGDSLSPGSKILEVDGTILNKYGVALSGNAYITARFQNATGTRGVNLGYDNAEVLGLIIADQASSGLAFWTHNGSAFGERVRLSSPGNVLVGGTAVRGTTVGTKAINIFDGTAPAGTLTNGISIYSASGECYIMDAAGNATLQSPHDSETGEWIFYSKNTITGREIRVDMERMIPAIERVTGETFMSVIEKEAIK